MLTQAFLESASEQYFALKPWGSKEEAKREQREIQREESARKNGN
jgi:hypothetical protein